MTTTPRSPSPIFRSRAPSVRANNPPTRQSLLCVHDWLITKWIGTSPNYGYGPYTTLCRIRHPIHEHIDMIFTPDHIFQFVKQLSEYSPKTEPPVTQFYDLYPR